MKTEKKAQPEMVQVVPEKNLVAHGVILFTIALAAVTILLIFRDVHQKFNASAGNGNNPVTSKMVNDTKDGGHDVGNGRVISADAGYVMPERTASDLQKAGFGTTFHSMEIVSTNATAAPQRTAGK